MLTQADIDKCREAFERFDKDGSGSIDAWELKETLKAMGQNPTEEEVFQMLAQVDDDGSGTIDFPEFLKVIEQQKEAMEWMWKNCGARSRRSSSPSTSTS